jgi:hypothetical protein
MDYALEERIGNPDLFTGRKEELLEKLPLNIDDAELEKKLKALVMADIITQGQTNFDYRGVQDNIFDKVFRGVYEKEIRHFDVKVIKKEYQQEFTNLTKQYKRLVHLFHKSKGELL